MAGTQTRRGSPAPSPSSLWATQTLPSLVASGPTIRLVQARNGRQRAPSTIMSLSRTACLQRDDDAIETFCCFSAVEYRLVGKLSLVTQTFRRGLSQPFRLAPQTFRLGVLEGTCRGQRGATNGGAAPSPTHGSVGANHAVVWADDACASAGLGCVVLRDAVELCVNAQCQS